uniref:Basic helix-loop-helix transcription factor amos-like n=1 Tax=Saccoglossus kowalevskii TaxID=10224 RepID=A0ABM0M789_SACKO|nr:PREDICTED: basic helix-loop-helix transcription factor amos-like [Saccoglossus kowalevskii]
MTRVKMERPVPSLAKTTSSDVYSPYQIYMNPEYVPLHGVQMIGHTTCSFARLYGTNGKTEIENDSLHPVYPLESSESVCRASHYIDGDKKTLRSTKSTEIYDSLGGIQNEVDTKPVHAIKIQQSCKVESRKLANSKERARMNSIRDGFDMLRDILPKSCTPFGGNNCRK